MRHAHTLRSRLSTLGSNTDGAAGVLLAASLPPLMCAAAIAIDLGSLYLAERRLQGVADAAAMAATGGDIVSDGERRAFNLIQSSNIDNVSIVRLTPGVYRADRAIAVPQRFQATDHEPTAARILLEQRVPLFFAKAFVSEDQSTLRAQATAQRTEIAAYSLGSSLIDVSGGIPNAMLSQLAGTQLNLSVLDTQGLATTQIDVVGFADALKAEVGNDGETYGEIFGREVPASAVIAALAAASDDPDTSQNLGEIAMQMAERTVRLADIIDLGPYARASMNDGNSGVSVDAYSLLRSVLELSLGDSYTITFEVAVPGTIRTTVTLTGGSAMRSSPWLTITQARNYVLRTSQARMLIDVQASAGGLATINVPIFLELAEAEARMSDIDCTRDTDTNGVTLQVTPSVGTVALGQVDRAAFSDLGTEMTVVPARLLRTAAASVTGYSEIDLGGASPQPVRFSMEEIEERATKTVGTNDVFAAVASSLVENVTLQAELLGLGLNAGALSSTVGQALGLIAPALDAAIFSTTQAAGLKVGAADVRVDMARCGVPSLVA